MILGVDKLFYTILSDSRTSGKLTVSGNTDILNAFKGEELQLYAGYKNCPVSISFESNQKKGELKISSDVLEALSIPTHLSYQLIPFKDGIKIGPVVGLLMFKNKKNMTEKSLDALLNYTLLYNSIKGPYICF